MKTALPPAGYCTEHGYWLGAEAQIEPDAEIEAGCQVGDNACIEARVQLSGYTVIGAGSSVGGGSTLHGCILGERVQIGDGCHLVDCIIDDECVIEPMYACATPCWGQVQWCAPTAQRNRYDSAGGHDDSHRRSTRQHDCSG